MELAFVLAGLLVGALVGLTGMGGGSLMTPILVLVLRVPVAVAVGTDLAYTCVTNGVGALQHWREGHVRMRPALWLALGSIPATIGGVGFIAKLRSTGTDIDLFTGHAIGVVLIFVAAMMLLQPWLRTRLWPKDQEIFLTRLERFRHYRPLLLVAVGALVGFLVGLTSVGGGSLVMIALLLFFPRWPMNRRVGVDVMQAFLLSSAAATAHWTLGTVDFAKAGLLVIGSIPGVYFGARLSKVVPDRFLRPLIAGALAFSAWRLLLA